MRNFRPHTPRAGCHGHMRLTCASRLTANNVELSSTLGAFKYLDVKIVRHPIDATKFVYFQKIFLIQLLDKLATTA